MDSSKASDRQMGRGPGFFQEASRFSVGTQYNIGHQTSIVSAGLLDTLNPIPDASYTRNRKRSPPDSNCLPGTRQEVIQKVTSWADSSILLNSNSHVMWLYGYVGCGKSAIAQVVAEAFARKKRLAASFFFFRGSGHRSTTTKFAATIASQIAAAIPSTAPFIEASLKAHAGLLSPSTSLSAQFQRLVYEPIQAVKWELMRLNWRKGPLLIVLDGLDECEDNTRNRKTSPPDSNCLPGTRQEVIQKVTSWVDSSLLFNSSHVMWLYGYVGCGKSAIAQAVAETFADRKRLAASFFFFRGSGDRSRVARFATTVAGQVAAAIPATAPYIEAAAKAHAGMLHPSTSLGSQFQHLVYDPIKAVKWDKMGLNVLRGPFLIVMDGLDECDDREEVVTFIEHMLEFFQKNPRVPLRILITSRVEEHIRTRLPVSKQIQLINLVDHTSENDIAIAFRKLFAIAAKHDRVIEAYGEWPTPNDLQQLVKHTGCSFIFMSTIAKFILEPSDDGLTPIHRLPMALNIIDIRASMDSEPVSIIELADLLSIQTFEVVHVLVNLHAILQVPGDNHTPVTLCHSSLLDFLTDQKRSGRFHSAPPYHEYLAYQCIEIVGKATGSGRPKTPANNYAREYWDYHWEIIARKVRDGHPEERRIQLKTIITFLHRTFPPAFGLALATYIWSMDFRLPAAFGAIISKEIAKRSPRGKSIAYKVTNAHILVDLLGRQLSGSQTKVVIGAPAALFPEPNYNLRFELEAVWDEIIPPLPALASFHYDLARQALRQFITEGTTSELPHNSWLRFKPSDAPQSSPSLFLWCLLNWPKNLVLALEHDPTISRSLYKEDITSFSLFWRPVNRKPCVLMTHFVQILGTKELQTEKEHFIQNVRSAARTIKAMLVFEKDIHLYTREWQWEIAYEPAVFLGTQQTGSDMVSLWDVLAGFVKLVECLEGCCNHGFGSSGELRTCPFNDRDQNPGEDWVEIPSTV
ncbi:hypothetical protein DFP72DRAFT_1133079 [Ephemerocybe angulata]|uniref:Nephrocystin 3-like N-terminal domain-containing protein n=1 Tax=Ephemerocybe angulata TaxID=980116 RepID=A0A8H6M4C6_9AGAR|nr:hypothetical protein DFP72DRAFT_1133079 [Tulosesus angulatus]